MNIGITGASGFIGRVVVDLALRRGHEVIAFSRRPERGIPGCEMRLFSTERPPDLTGCDAVIHLAAENVASLWTPAKKRRIRETRVHGTRRVAEAFAAAAHPPEVLVCGSAIGFYGNSGDRELTEAEPHGTGFLAETVRAWEQEATLVTNARVVLLRNSIVLGPKGGALRFMTPLFRAGLGGQIANGRQWVSWIHVEDAAALALFAVEDLEVRGPVNSSAPWPVRNADFTRALAQAVRRPAIVRVPAFALRVLGDFSEELLHSKRVLPQAALDHGFQFRFPELPAALAHLLP
jgi:uncharacterized protein (TIGR01777 family)